MFTMIGAISLNNCVGINNDLPWRIPSDLQFFKSKTQYESIIMGWNTYLSLNKKPLPRRDNIVLVRDGFNMEDSGIDGFRFMTFNDIIKEESENANCSYFVIGGPKTWDLFKEHYINAIVTRVDIDIDGDAYVSDDLLENLKPNPISKDFRNVDTSKDQFKYSIEFYHKI